MQAQRNFSSASTLFALALVFLASPVNSLAGGAPPTFSPLVIEGASPSIHFDDTGDESPTDAWDWAIYTDGGIEDLDSNNTFQILDYSESCGRGGLAPEGPSVIRLDECIIPVVTINSNGTDNTRDAIYVSAEGTVSTAGKIHVGSQDTPVGQFTITSADQPRFELNDTTNNRRWRFSVTNTAFAINNLDEAGTEFKSLNNGDLEIGGTLFENSDRNSKQDIVAVDHLSVLDRIVALPISEWSYKDAPNQRHIGPMAQDFHAAFGLGRNNTGISTLDTAGVALAGIKALKWQNDRLAAKTEKLAAENGKLAVNNHQLAAENAELKARMDAMESRQAEIMVALATLRAQQDQPAPVVASLRD